MSRVRHRWFYLRVISACPADGAGGEIDGRPIVTIYTALGGISPEERAAKIQERILRYARHQTLSADAIRAEDIGSWAER